MLNIGSGLALLGVVLFLKTFCMQLLILFKNSVDDCGVLFYYFIYDKAPHLL